MTIRESIVAKLQRFWESDATEFEDFTTDENREVAKMAAFGQLDADAFIRWSSGSGIVYQPKRGRYPFLRDPEEETVRSRQSENLPPEIKRFNHDEIDRAITKLRRRIDEVKSLDPEKIVYSDAKVETVEENIHSSILDIFGPRSPEYNLHQYHRIWHGDDNVMHGDFERQNNFVAGIPQTISMLEGLVARVEEQRDDLSSRTNPAVTAPSTRKVGRSVFVVHGADEASKLAVARLLEKLQLQVTILHEKVNEGRTLL